MRQTPSAGRPVRFLGAVALLALVVLAAHSSFGLGGRGPDRFFDDYLYIGVQALASSLCLIRAFTVREGRAAWLVIGIGIGSSGLGDAVFNFGWKDTASVPYPSIADVFYLAFYPATFAALVLLARRRLGRPEPGVWLDGVIVGLVLAAITAALAFPAIVDATSGDAATVATTLAYPLCDLVLLFVVGTAFTMTGFRPGRSLALIGLGLLLWAVADCIYAYQVSAGIYREGTLLDASWPTGVLLVALAAWQPVQGAERKRVETLPVFVVSLAFTLLALGLVIFDHYIRLPVVALWLASAAVLVGVMRTAISFVEKLRALRRAETYALTDGLTGIGNRRLLIQDLDEALSLATASPPRTLVFYDLDGFKHYNDVFGHSAGDALLTRFGHRLAGTVAGQGHAYRLGGDEFCLLLDREARPGDELLERAGLALTDAGNGFEVLSSSGCVSIPDETHTAEGTLQLADERMYQDKGSGRRTPEHETPDVLLQILHEQEPDLHGHVTDVAAHTAAVARELAIDPEGIVEIKRAGQLHDIGKVAIPAAILHKPGPLNDEEWAFMRQHTLIGERILVAAPALRPVARLVRLSHERWDGEGYPDGLAGDEIPLGARIVSVCDAYDAMVSTRSYSRSISPAAGLAELRRCSGTQFDPVVVEAFAAVLAAEAAASAALAVR